MKLNDIERKIISDVEFLKHKISAIDKIQNLFEEVRKELINSIDKSSFYFPKEIDTKIGKIFRGENYRLLPYVVLDFPKYFEQENIFTFRTMFWWGNFFSTTLHLKGKFLDSYKENIYKNFDLLNKNNIYICVNESPWEYHYEPDNYELLNAQNKDLILEKEFVKLSKKFKLTEYENLPKLSYDYLSLSLNAMTN